LLPVLPQGKRKGISYAIFDEGEFLTRARQNPTGKTQGLAKSA